MSLPELSRYGGWDLVSATFVDPDEFLNEFRYHVRFSMVAAIIAEALARAADDKGILYDFNPEEFFVTYVTGVMRSDPGEIDFQLTWDRFTSMVLVSTMTSLLHKGLLGHRDNGDSIDYRLALPVK